MQQPLKFCKMHGLGNDIVITQDVFPLERIQKLADRRIGIGFDQIIFLESSKKAAFFCRIFNADGSEAEQCGNGMRCVARFVHENKLVNEKSFMLETKAGIVSVDIHDYDTIKVNMGIPKLEKKNVVVDSYDLTLISMGNPHAILSVSSLNEISVDEVGLSIGTNSFFPQGTNVGFLEIIDREHVRLNTFERGVGRTLACGSNSCAAVVAGIWNGWLDKKVQVELMLGSLLIEWAGENESVFMTGPATRIFDGTMHHTI